MLREDENRRLNETGPGTPMGELMRRYWQPIAAAGELDETPVKQVRLLSEDLVLYKDRNGTFGLVDLHCPHRRADMSYGIIEQEGIRCNYHGWRYVETGQCVEQPFDDIAHPDVDFKAKIQIKSYPVRERGGLLWAYLGPSPVPEVPNWGPFTWENGIVQMVFTEIPYSPTSRASEFVRPMMADFAGRSAVGLRSPTATVPKAAMGAARVKTRYRVMTVTPRRSG